MKLVSSGDGVVDMVDFWGVFMLSLDMVLYRGREWEESAVVTLHEGCLVFLYD